MRILPLLVSLALPAALTASPRRKPAPRRPNVLLIVADDLGVADLGCTGSSFHRTPELDRLARQGVRFTQAYAASPVCSPSRASLFTGLHPARLGITDWIGAERIARPLSTPAILEALPEDAPTLGERFAEAGYATGYVGKWHLGTGDALPRHRGFAWTFGVNNAGQPSSHLLPCQGPTPSPRDVPDLDEGAAGGYLADALTDAAMGFLEAHRVEPFLLVLSHYAVHTPLEAPEADVAACTARAQALPALASDGVPEGSARTRARQDHPVYAAMVENLDRNVGRMLAKLTQLGLERDTLVVFVSDNGGLSTLAGERPGPTCNAPCRAGKGWLYEGGLRVPLLVRGPGMVSGKAIDVPVSVTDLMPTLMDLAGLPAAPQADGRSVASVLRTGKVPRETAELVFHYPHFHGSGSRPAAALRSGDLKLVRWFEGDRLELFDLAKDPSESKNLAAERPELVKSLAARLDERLKALGAKLPGPPEPTKQ